MLYFRIRDCRVVRFIPRRAAAPSAPPTIPLVERRAFLRPGALRPPDRRTPTASPVDVRTSDPLVDIDRGTPASSVNDFETGRGALEQWVVGQSEILLLFAAVFSMVGEKSLSRILRVESCRM